MGLIRIDNSQNTKYSAAVIRRSANLFPELDWALDGVPDPDPTGVSNRVDPLVQPFGLGSGKLVNSTGTYLYHEGMANGPVEKFVVYNAGQQTLYAGINVASGDWSVSNGLSIPSGQSYEFGDSGTQIIRNVWAITQSATATARGYATNQPLYKTLN